MGRTDLNFCFRPVNVGYILNLISNLKPSVSCGLDNISSSLLKLCSPYISDSICDVINHVLETGIFPDDWKKAKVHPIFKSDERKSTDFYSTCHFENYRKGHALRAVRVFSSR